MRPPAHLIPAAAEHHGVARYARQLSDHLGAQVIDGPVWDPMHVHVTDRLLGPTPEAAGRVVADLCRRTRVTLTLHDVPQRTDGVAFDRRARAYARMLDHAAGWVVSSLHEFDQLTRHVLPLVGRPRAGAVIPLPVVDPLPLRRGPGGGPTATVALAGWVYPGKGHREVIEAAAALGRRMLVRALGAVTPGHQALVDELARYAASLGVGFEVTGSLSDVEMTRALRAADVGVAAHRNVSASASVAAWVAAGRRPLVRDGAYAREMAALRPGTLTLVREADLPHALARALAEPVSTLLAPGVGTGPHLDDTAAAYLAWWGSFDG